MARTSPSGVKKDVWRFLTWSRSGMMGTTLGNAVMRFGLHGLGSTSAGQGIADSISHSIKSAHCQYGHNPTKNRHAPIA
jgi:hypothetical protein